MFYLKYINIFLFIYLNTKEYFITDINSILTSKILSPDCRRPSFIAAPFGKMFFTKMGPGPCMEESLVTTVKPSPSGPSV